MNDFFQPGQSYIPQRHLKDLYFGATGQNKGAWFFRQGLKMLDYLWDPKYGEIYWKTTFSKYFFYMTDYYMNNDQASLGHALNLKQEMNYMGSITAQTQMQNYINTVTNIGGSKEKTLELYEMLKGQ